MKRTKNFISFNEIIYTKSFLWIFRYKKTVLVDIAINSTHQSSYSISSEVDIREIWNSGECRELLKTIFENLKSRYQKECALNYRVCYIKYFDIENLEFLVKKYSISKDKIVEEISSRTKTNAMFVHKYESRDRLIKYLEDSHINPHTISISTLEYLVEIVKDIDIKKRVEIISKNKNSKVIPEYTGLQYDCISKAEYYRELEKFLSNYIEESK